MYFREGTVVPGGERPSTSVTCRGYRGCLVWNSMPLRCLLFSSNEEMVQPIWQVLTDLGIEGEYCKSAVDAVERVTTQPFQIVITDWQDQPEAAFLLKTARDLKAAQRPLTLAIVGEDARPQALQAGANSVLLKPIRVEQVRDTMSTACELLRSKFQPGAPAVQRATSQPAAMAAAASTTAASAPASVTQAPEKIRAVEFLQRPSSTPGEQFDTENEVKKSMEAPAAEVDALSELEPTAAVVQATPEAKPEPQEALTGWAALQARLTKSAPAKTPVKTEDAPAKSEVLSYAETPSYGAPAAAPATEQGKAAAKPEPHRDNTSEAALFAYMSRESKESSDPVQAAGPKRGKVLLLASLAVASVVLMAVPRTRQSLQVFFRSAVHTGGHLLNPPPAALPQAVALHDSFGQSGDEYKLPVAGNIPDATTDASQIQVVPVLDPTAKPDKNSQATAAQAQETTGDSTPTDAATNQNQVPDQSPQTQQPENQPQANQAQANQAQANDPTVTSGGNPPGAATPALPPSAPSSTPQLQNPPTVQVTPPRPPAATPVRVAAPSHSVSAAENAGIPSSLKSQIASSTPESSGNKPMEAAMSSIEPVKLPEAAIRELLSQPVDPEYPASAKASGQRGSVVLQVLIGRDGTVQDAKFLQGSLVFARAAIDAVKQWRFKPYSMNGRAVSVEGVITLNFKAPS
jgi:periplasmic protein TonB